MECSSSFLHIRPLVIHSKKKKPNKQTKKTIEDGVVFKAKGEEVGGGGSTISRLPAHPGPIPL